MSETLNKPKDMTIFEGNTGHYTELIQKMDYLGKMLNRDRLKFQFYGYPQGELELFEREIAQLKLLSSDAYYKRKETHKLLKKEDLKHKLQAQLNNIGNDLRTRLKVKSSEDILKLTDKQLIDECYLIDEALTQLNQEKTSIAANIELKETFEKLVVELEEATFELSEIIELRNSKLDERNDLLKKIFNQCTEISKQGQSIWNTINLKNHDDYKFYEIAINAEQTEIARLRKY